MKFVETTSLDTLQPAEQNARMALIRSKDTRPELAVRRLVHGMGYRYRLHARDLPGRPDLVFRARRKVIFVHGCFWHRHDDPNCKLARLPSSRLDFWLPKLGGNKARDERGYQRIRWHGLEGHYHLGMPIKSNGFARSNC